jgi:hypothetical protein
MGLKWKPVFAPLINGTLLPTMLFVDGNIESKSGMTGKDTSIYNLYRRPKNAFQYHRWFPGG